MWGCLRQVIAEQTWCCGGKNTEAGQRWFLRFKMPLISGLRWRTDLPGLGSDFAGFAALLLLRWDRQHCEYYSKRNLQQRQTRQTWTPNNQLSFEQGEIFINNRKCRIVQRHLIFKAGIAYGIDCLLTPPSLGGRCDEQRTFDLPVNPHFTVWDASECYLEQPDILILTVNADGVGARVLCRLECTHTVKVTVRA